VDGDVVGVGRHLRQRELGGVIEALASRALED
jgi:hypothetical protein